MAAIGSTTVHTDGTGLRFTPRDSSPRDSVSRLDPDNPVKHSKPAAATALIGGDRSSGGGVAADLRVHSSPGLLSFFFSLFLRVHFMGRMIALVLPFHLNSFPFYLMTVIFCCCLWSNVCMLDLYNIDSD